MQNLFKLNMDSLYGVQNQKDINEHYKCKSEHWMQTEYDENVLEFRKLPNWNHKVNLGKADGLEGDKDVKNTLPSHLRAFILSNSKRFMKDLIRKFYGFITYNVYYTDPDSLYIEQKY